MTEKQLAKLQHDAHVRYQRNALRADAVHTAPTELRGVAFQHFLQEWLVKQRAAQLNAVCTGLRSNFWRAYVETIIYMSK